MSFVLRPKAHRRLRVHFSHLSPQRCLLSQPDSLRLAPLPALSKNTCARFSTFPLQRTQDTTEEPKFSDSLDASFDTMLEFQETDGTFKSENILIEHRKGVRFVTLTREKALNALNHDMVKQLTPIYRAYNSDPSTSCIVLKSSSPKAFCAGGDIVDIVKSKDPSFFADEYKLDKLIAKLCKPHISIWNGIVMGGGVGLSVHGSFRISTESALFAMPETAIGFFPDVGGSYFLPRLKGANGYYLGLTGTKLKGKDIYHAGLSNYHIDSKKLPELEKLLVRLDSSSPIDIRNCIKYVIGKKDLGPPKHVQEIDQVFNPDVNPTVESIMKDLEGRSSAWAATTLKKLQTLSPTSLKVTYELLKRGKTMDFDACFDMELNVAKHMLRNHDFPEGVRALLIDKDFKAQWKPDTLSEVSDEAVQEYFQDHE